MGGIVIVVSACLGSSDTVSQTTTAAETTLPAPVAVTAPPPTFLGPASFERPASAIYFRDSEEFPAALIDIAELVPGGPAPDGIAPLEDPEFVTVDEVNFLADQDAVLVVDLGGEAKAFPTQIMIWHEIANTSVGGTPLTVSYCPLCNSAVAFERTHRDGTVMDFGTSGLLYRSSLVMYDRQTFTLWTHFDGVAVHGVMAGNELTLVPVSTVSFADFAEAHPNGLVLSRHTGFSRRYGVNPYLGYDSNGVGGTLHPAPFDDAQAPALARVVVVRGSQDSVAVFHEHLLTERVVPIVVDDEEVVVFLEPGTATPLQSGLVALGRDVGATGVFAVSADGESLTFVVGDDGGFVDNETGSTWNIFGHATAGELAGAELRAVEHLDTFWFAIATFRPNTQLIGVPAIG